MEPIDIIRILCKENGINLPKLEGELGYSNGSLAKAKDIPSSRILSIARYFDVSMEYIMTGTQFNKDDTLSKLEKKVIEKCRANESDYEYVCKMLGLKEEYRLDKLYKGGAAM